MKKLSKIRQSISIITWILIVVNLSIIITTFVISGCTDTMIWKYKPAILTVMSIAGLIGLFALADMILYINENKPKNNKIDSFTIK